MFQRMYCPTRFCLFLYSFGTRVVHPEMRWSIVSVLVLQNLHLGSAPLWRILAWKFLVKRLWSCAATINPSDSALSPALLSHRWLSCKSTSAFWLRRGYWPCKGFDFQAVSIIISISYYYYYYCYCWLLLLLLFSQLYVNYCACSTLKLKLLIF